MSERDHMKSLTKIIKKKVDVKLKVDSYFLKWPKSDEEETRLHHELYRRIGGQEFRESRTEDQGFS